MKLPAQNLSVNFAKTWRGFPFFGEGERERVFIFCSVASLFRPGESRETVSGVRDQLIEGGYRGYGCGVRGGSLESGGAWTFRVYSF